jgi:glucose/arabinose dehydrogenase
VASPARGTLAATLPPGFYETQITQDIKFGTALEIAPDGKLFVLEQLGTVQVYEGHGPARWRQVSPNRNFFSGSPLAVNTSGGGERGLLGIAFDPHYSQNRFVYFYYTTGTASVGIHNRVSRFIANEAGNQVVAQSEAVLMDFEPGGAFHNGGAIQFGPDGFLYVGVGDGGYASNGQSIETRLGKILRLNPDPNDPIPNDNPSSIEGIAGSPSGVNQAIWAAGLRNPFRFTFKPGTSLMYINDVGEFLWEEVNIGSPGANYGWGLTEGPFDPTLFVHFTHPIVYYHHGHDQLSVPPLPGFTGAAVVGGAFYDPQTSTFPGECIGNYFFADLTGWIKRYDPATKSMHDFAFGAGMPVDMRVADDGSLFYLRGVVAAGHVVRVQYSPPCSADIAVPGTLGVIDIDDLLTVIQSWGMTGDTPADINRDGTVDAEDLAIVVYTWGPCP